MSAAVAFRAPLSLHAEGLAFWQELINESERHVKAVNAAATARGLADSHLVEWKTGRGIIGIVRKWYPSTDITISLTFEHWGPVIKVLVTGYQHEDLRFYPEEQEVPIARDLDGRTVAVLGEGRSYSPTEFARYLVQHLRRCFPDLALPYSPLELREA
jgi:putative N-acetylmannosamine-6-phosphate epimerase